MYALRDVQCPRCNGHGRPRIIRDRKEWIACVLGLWIAVSPWVLGFQHTVAMFINLAVGLSIAYLALLDLWLTHYGQSTKKQSSQLLALGQSARQCCSQKP